MGGWSGQPSGARSRSRGPTVGTKPRPRRRPPTSRRHPSDGARTIAANAMARRMIRIGLSRHPLGPERRHRDLDPTVVEDDRRRAGERPGQRRRPVLGDRPGRAGGLVGRAAQVVVGQAQAPLLLGGEDGRRGDRATAMVAGGRRAPPAAVGRTEIGADRAQVRLGAGVRRGRRGALLVVDRGHGGKDTGRAGRGRLGRPVGPGRPVGWPTDRPVEGARNAKNPGDDLFSRKAALSVSSALESLTSVFGMGTGVASPLESPGFFASGSFRQRLDATVRQDRAGRRNGLRYRVVNGI